MLLRYQCHRCENNITKIVESLDTAVGVMACLDCGGFLERVISGPSSNSIETIDNGSMANKVEFDAQQQELRKKVSDSILKEKKS